MKKIHDRDFFKHLAARLQDQKTSRNFDRKFWEKFDQEFSKNSHESWLENLRDLFMGHGALYPASVVAGLLVVSVFYSRLPTEEKKPGSLDLAAAIEWSETTEIAQDLEMFDDANEWVLTASDDDWEILLNENET